MGNRQLDFLSGFREAFQARLRGEVLWGGGQTATNTAGLQPDLLLRRDGRRRTGERFELGDLRCDISVSTVVVEYESGAMAVHNLLKYWPYLRGELGAVPTRPILLCHFSDWSSYGSYRDLWQWLLNRMKEDSYRRVEFHARQFDHGGTDVERANRSLSEALDWLARMIHESSADYGTA